jgi:uncharacterized protein YcnI
MKSTLRRVLAAAGLVGLLVAGMPGGAGAEPLAPKATAKLDVHQALAGAQQSFTLTVGNPLQGLLNPIRSVKIVAPGDLFTIAAPVDPTGWTGTITGAGSTLTYKTSGSGIAGGASQSFTFLAQALRPATDLSRSFAVSTSPNAGTTSTYTPVQQAAGALGVRLRTLEILGIAVTEPENVAGVVPVVFTAGQELTLAVRVSNAASAAQTVSTTLTGATAMTSSPTPLTIDAGDIVEVPFDVALSDAVGHGKVVANASAGESSAVQRFLAYRTDAPLDALATTDGHGWEVAPGTERTFDGVLRWQVPTNDVTVDVDATYFSFGNGAFEVPIDAAGFELDGDSWQDQLGTSSAEVRSVPVTIPDSLADGTYDAVLHLEGIDEHGASVVRDLAFDEPLLVDSDIPTADIHLDTPPFTDGSTVTFHGTIYDGEERCGDCGLRDARLDAIDADGAVVGAIPVGIHYCEDEGSLGGGCEDGYTNDDGVIGGSIVVGEWPEGTVLTRFVATVWDPTNLTSSFAGYAVSVDILPPVLRYALTTIDSGAVTVGLSEDVEMPEIHTDRLDWTCDGHTVGEASTSYNEVWLSVSPTPGPDELLTCSYAPKAGRVRDRVGYELADLPPFTTKDWIHPDAPLVDAPAFTNTATPTLTVTNVNAGDTVNVFEDGAVVGTATATGTSVAVTTGSLGTNDRVAELRVQTTDKNGNTGFGTRVEITLDFTAPSLATASISRSGRQVTVTFAEPLVGPAAADDWSVSGPTATGPRQTYALGSVDVEDEVVTLTIADPRFTSDTVVDAVAYEVLAADGATRLTDRAGNVLADSSVTF